MLPGLNRIGQISLPVSDPGRSEAFYANVPAPQEALPLIARMDDHDLWMAFLEGPDRHTLAVMQETPKGYGPPKI